MPRKNTRHHAARPGFSFDYAQDFGSRLIRLLDTSTSLDKNKSVSLRMTTRGKERETERVRRKSLSSEARPGRVTTSLRAGSCPVLVSVGLGIAPSLLSS